MPGENMTTYAPLTYFPVAFLQDGSGRLASGTLEVRDAVTDATTVLYSDTSGTSVSSPISLNERGEPTSSGNVINLYGVVGSTYKFTLKDSGGNTVWEEDSVPVGIAGGTLTLVTIAAIQSGNLTGVTAIQTLGYSSAGDGGAAFYWADTSDNSTADNGFDCIVSNDGVRFKLVHDGTVNIMQAGADATGTTAINDLWATVMELFSDGNGGEVVVPSFGDFLVAETYRSAGDLDDQLDVPYDNITIRLDGNLTIENTDKRHICLLFGRRRGSTSTTANPVSNIRLTGKGTIQGNTGSRTATSQWSVGVYVSNCNDSLIDGVSIDDFYGENIYIDALPYGPVDGDDNTDSIPRRVVISNVNMSGGYRNNVSVQNSESIKFIGCSANGSSGSAPQAGFNVEPTYTDDANGYYCKDLQFIGCTANDNDGSGFELVDTDAGTIDNILVMGCHVKGNGTSSNGFGGIRVISTDGDGSIRIIGNEVIGNYGLGIDHDGGDNVGGAFAARRVIIANNFVSGTLEGTKESIQMGYGISCRRHVIGTVVTGNVVEKCAHHGIYVASIIAVTNQDILIAGNQSYANSQQTDDTYDNIHIGQYCTLIHVVGNQVRKSSAPLGVSNQPRYGIYAESDYCSIVNNDVYDGGKSGNLHYSFAKRVHDDATRHGVVKNNYGHRNENVCRSSAIDCSSTGTGTVSIAHGLDTYAIAVATTASAKEQVKAQFSLTPIVDGTTGGAFMQANVLAVTSTDVVVQYNITSAAAVNMRIGCQIKTPE